jgi:3-deoxy-D-manno-octulosonate 8-phosphate phosphatase (KDO 8-P phosphatase)
LFAAGSEAAMIEERAKKIKLLILDLDGVLTDGRIIYDNFGDEFKCFNVQDGLGFSLLHTSEIKAVIITAKKSKSVLRRAREMGVVKVYQNVWQKLKIYERILKKFKFEDSEVCFIGDDLIDIPILKRVGLAVAVANGVQEVKDCAHYVTQREGGKGAAREVIEFILKSQNLWSELIEKHINIRGD